MSRKIANCKRKGKEENERERERERYGYVYMLTFHEQKYSKSPYKRDGKVRVMNRLQKKKRKNI